MDRSLIPLNDLQAQQRRIAPELQRRIQEVLSDGRFIMGPAVAELEKKLAAFVGVEHCVSCANGTDALVLALRVLKIGPGDWVVVPAYTFAATAEAVVLVGARPIFVDVDPETFVITPEILRQALEASRHPIRAVIPVDLFGMIPDYAGLTHVAQEFGVEIISDAAQSFGSARDGKRAGAFGRLATTSFFPAKPLGCYGDGGALFTSDPVLATELRSLRVHGQGTDKYDNVHIGMNSRLDTIQAAVLLEKFAAFPAELELRAACAARYHAELEGYVTIPKIPEQVTSNWAQYSVLSTKRDELAAHLKKQGISSAVYYPRALSDQPAYRAFGLDGFVTSTSRKLATSMLSIPMYPDLSAEDQTRVIEAIREMGKML